MPYIRTQPQRQVEPWPRIVHIGFESHCQNVLTASFAVARVWSRGGATVSFSESTLWSTESPASISSLEFPQPSDLLLSRFVSRTATHLCSSAAFLFLTVEWSSGSTDQPCRYNVEGCYSAYSHKKIFKRKFPKPASSMYTPDKREAIKQKIFKLKMEQLEEERERERREQEERASKELDEEKRRQIEEENEKAERLAELKKKAEALRQEKSTLFGLLKQALKEEAQQKEHEEDLERQKKQEQEAQKAEELRNAPPPEPPQPNHPLNPLRSYASAIPPHAQHVTPLSVPLTPLHDPGASQYSPRPGMVTAYSTPKPSPYLMRPSPSLFSHGPFFRVNARIFACVQYNVM